jgi:diguanylate cyclase (GGDEF)-like protein/PAS domain S-box-containing protein
MIGKSRRPRPQPDLADRRIDHRHARLALLLRCKSMVLLANFLHCGQSHGQQAVFAARCSATVPTSKIMSSSTESSIELKHVYDSAVTYAIYTIDLTGKVTTWNAGAERVFGFTAQEMIGQNTAAIFTPEDRASNESQRERETAVNEGCASDYRWHLRKNGTCFWADGAMTPIRDDKGIVVGCLKIAKDITNRKLAQEEIRRLATVDVLTGLASRSYFDKQFSELVTKSVEGRNLLIVHLVDLDHFKQVNDTYGHPAGDILLQQAAQRMRNITSETDFIARLGGDEFAVVQLQASSPEAGGDLASRLVDALAQPFGIAGFTVEISASIGIAICPDDAKEAGELLKKADMALYRAKTHGRNGFHYFTSELDNAAHQKRRDIAGIRHAVANESFCIEYQPIINYRTGQITAVEALVRFANPALSTRGLDYLLSLATEAGLTPHIGNWVLSKACAQLREWKEAGVGELKMHVNMCSQELMDANVLDLIKRVLSESRLEPADLEIEITEREAIDIEDHGVNTLCKLHSQGISLALDDFGTGYSALSYLRNLPVTTLKLDKSFLKGIPEETHNCAIAKLVLGLAQALGLKLIIEGVESIEQAEFLAGAGCTTFQGFLISKPVEAEQLTKFLIDKAKGSGQQTH